MQAKTSTLTLIKNSSFFRIAVTMLLTIGFMSLSKSVSAQLMVKIEDIEYFAPPSSSGQNTSTSFFNTSNQNTHSPSSKMGSPSLTVSPNPVNNQATVSKDSGVTLTKLEIIDMNGYMVFTGNFGMGSLYVPYLEPGYYNFRFYSSAGITNKVMGVN